MPLPASVPARRLGGAAQRGAWTVGLAGLVGAGLSLRFARGRQRAESEWRAGSLAPLDGLGSVSELRILPLVDAEAPADGLLVEHAVSYLVTVDELRILFDVGLGAGARRRSALVHNANALNVDLSSVDLVVISHPHPDHTGGPRAAVRRSFDIPDPGLDLSDVTALTPVPMHHRAARCEHVAAPRVIGPGIATTGAIPRMLFFLGWTQEQALLVNVRDRGVVVIVGCGHQGIERLLARVEALVQTPIYAIMGGLHLPVHGLRAQGFIGTAKWPWQRTTEGDVTDAIDVLRRRQPVLVAVSPHDSSPWTLDRFATAFGSGYRTIRVGEEIHIAADQTA